MNIPQVNARATDRNREQSKLIVRFYGHKFEELDDIPDVYVSTENNLILLPGGSFALDQVVGMLEAEGAYWGVMPAGWYLSGRTLARSDTPFNLTAAMDALIKVLETKKGEQP